MSGLLNERIARFDSPFRRLDALLAGVAPNPQPAADRHVGRRAAGCAAAAPRRDDRVARPPVESLPAGGRHTGVPARGAGLRRTPLSRRRAAGSIPTSQVSPVTSSREGPVPRRVDRDQSVARGAARRDAESRSTRRIGRPRSWRGRSRAYLAHSGFPEFALDLAAVDEATWSRDVAFSICARRRIRTAA